MVSHLRTPILNCFTYLLWGYLLTDSEFSCLAMLAKPYRVSGPTYLPQIPNQLHCMHMRCLGLSLWPDLCQFSLQNHLFCPYVTEALYLSLHCLCAAPLCCTCFDCGRIYPDFIDPVLGLALLYLCVDLILTW